MIDKYLDCQKYFVFHLKHTINNLIELIIEGIIEQAMASSSFDIKNDIIIYRKMICAILIHRKAIELVLSYTYIL